MRRSIPTLILLTLLPVALNAAEKPAAALGINLAGPADWNTELPFVDVFRLSRPWISQREGAGWGKGPPLKLDQHGWVTRLEPGCYAESPLCTIEGGHYPGGEYTVLYDGKGKMEFWGAAKVASSEPGKLKITVDPSRGGVFLRLRETDPSDYIRNIRVIMPGFAETYRENPWHPAFLERWRGLACLRFMDLMETNNSHIAQWSQRPTPSDATFSAKGVAAELLIDLSNRQNAAPWFCIPHLADDDYVRKLAQLVRDKLNPKLKVYVEYSNEVWNGQFQQHRHAAEQGKKLGLAEKPWEAAWRYTAVRSVEIFKIWEDVFGGRERLVRVLPSQAANAYVSEQVVSFREAYKHADALAIAPYVSLNISPNGKPSANEVAGWSVDQLLDHVERRSLPECVKWMRDSKKVADKFRLKLVAYEAGQHLVGIQGAENNEKLTKLLHAANAHPRMGKVYDQYYAAWEETGGGLLCHFSSVGAWSKWGSWGLLQYYDQGPSDSPKFAATMRWAQKLAAQRGANSGR